MGGRTTGYCSASMAGDHLSPKSGLGLGRCCLHPCHPQPPPQSTFCCAFPCSFYHSAFYTIICLHILHHQQDDRFLLTFESNVETRTGPCSDHVLRQILLEYEVAILVDILRQKLNFMDYTSQFLPVRFLVMCWPQPLIFSVLYNVYLYT